MAALSPDARGSPSAERFRLLRELRSKAVRAWAALESLAGGGTRLVVVERVARGATFSDQAIAEWVRDAKRLAALEHPNVARVRDVVIRGDEVLVASEFVDGVRWSELAAAEPAPPLEVGIRVLVDVLSGLSAIHNLRDAQRQPLKLIHGELTPEHVVVGADGVARVVSACRARANAAQRPPAAARYLAPEVLLADESADARADVYGVGVMLWETLTGRLLFEGLSPSMIVTHLLSGRVPRAAVPEDAPWAAPLVDVVARALSADPAQRFASATAFAAEVRRVAGVKLPSAPRVAAAVRTTFGEVIRERREALERGDLPAGREVSSVDERPADSIDVEVEPEPASRAPTPVPLPPTASTKPPPPLPAPPPPRPRQPTLAGVAPPVPEAARARAPSAPVVVPHSSRPPPPAAEPGAPKPDAGGRPAARDLEKPTPYVPFTPAMLASPRLPEDLAKALGAAAEPEKAVDSESAEAPPLTPVPVVETANVVVGPPSRRRARVAVVAAAVLLAGVLAIWLLSSSRGHDQVAASPTGRPTATAATKTTSTTSPVAATAAATAATTETAAASAIPGATAAAAPSTTSTIEPTAVPDARESAPPAVAGPASNPTPPPVPPRPAVRRKYEPEGI